MHPRHDDLAMQIYVARIEAEILRRHRQDAVQAVSLLESFPNHAIETCAAQVERLAFDRLREAPSIQAQRTVKEYACARSAFHVAASRCM